MKNLNEKQLFIISVTVSAILALGFLYGIYVQHSNRVTLEEEIADLKSKEEKLDREKVQKIPEIKKSLAALRELQANELNFKLPTTDTAEESFLVLIEDLQKFAGETNLEITSTQHMYTQEDKSKKKKKGAVASNFETIRIAYDFKAKFVDAITFINKLEIYSRIMTIETLNIEGGKSDDGVYDMQLVVAVYVFKAPEVKEPAPAPKANAAAAAAGSNS